MPASNHPPALSDSPNSGRTEARARVLLVDDRPDKALALQSVIEELGYELAIASSGSDGLRQLLHSHFDLLVIDVEMPDMNGIEVARLVRSREVSSKVPIIFVSALEDGDERVEQARALEAVDFIELPERRPVLKMKISAALRDSPARNRSNHLFIEREAQLVAAEERFRLFMENAKDVSIIFVDQVGLVVDWSCGAERCFGWTKAEALGKPLSLVFTLEDAAQRIPEQKLSESLLPNAPFDERWLLKKDGSQFWATSRFVALTSASALGFAIISRDTTERRASEQELRIRAEVLSTMVESVCVIDQDLTIRYANAAAENIFGYATGELIGMNVTLLNHYPAEEHRMKVAELLHQLREHKCWEGDWQNQKKDGTPITTYARVTLLEFRGVEWFVCVQEDMTAWQEARTELLQTKAELEARVAERTSELKRLVDDLQSVAYSISHDVKTPIRAIAGYAEALIEDYAQQIPPPALSHLRQIRTAAQRLEQFVKDVLTHSRTTSTQPALVEVNPHEIIDDVIQQDLALLASTHHLRLEGGLPIVRADPELLGAVFRNLLTNAFKFVRANVDPQVIVRATSSETEVKFWVEDNGIGIPAADQLRIFEMFERGTRAKLYEGTGIGLAITKRAVERMGGTIGVESTPGVGSRFWFTLKSAQSWPGET